eukprot:c14412_g1_i1 orf=87-260(-)
MQHFEFVIGLFYSENNISFNIKDKIIKSYYNFHKTLAYVSHSPHTHLKHSTHTQKYI